MRERVRERAGDTVLEIASVGSRMKTTELERERVRYREMEEEKESGRE